MLGLGQQVRAALFTLYWCAVLGGALHVCCVCCSAQSLWLGGVLDQLPWLLLPFTCPTENSYARLKPGTWAGAATCWGWDNRKGLRFPHSIDVRYCEARRVFAMCAALWLGGVLDQLHWLLLPFTCPTENSYARLKPGTWAGAVTCWGWDNTGKSCATL
jgi:glutamine synthetase